MSYKLETKAAYDKLAEDYAQKFEHHASLYVGDHIRAFTSRLPKGARVLELGSGSGVHAQTFQEAGLNVLCTDLSPAMVDLCRSKGLQAVVADFEELEQEPESCDAVWAYTSLLHTTRDMFPQIIRKVHIWLKHGGLFGLAMKEGSGEGFTVSDKDGTSKRWFTYYSNDELIELLEGAGFQVLETSSINSNNQGYLNYLVQRPEPK